jgi:hypothetical protein
VAVGSGVGSFGDAAESGYSRGVDELCERWKCTTTD